MITPSTRQRKGFLRVQFYDRQRTFSSTGRASLRPLARPPQPDQDKRQDRPPAPPGSEDGGAILSELARPEVTPSLNQLEL